MAKNSKKSKFEKTTNEVIIRKYKRVKLVTDSGLKEMDSKVALHKAAEQNLDLVLMSVKGNVPVCKILDYNKHLYDVKKKEKEAQKKARKNSIKEIRLGLDIGDNDLDWKSDDGVKFLTGGASLKITLRIKGRRNMSRKDMGVEKIDAFFAKLQEKFDGKLKYSSKPKLQGKVWIAMIEKDKK